MPVRLLNSSVLKWPKAESVEQAVRRWADRIAHTRTDVRSIGYFGSYARGDWSVGSDLDVIVVVERSDQSFVKRASEWDLTELPVPTDVLVYTLEEWQALSNDSRFHQTLKREAVWIYRNDRS